MSARDPTANVNVASALMQTCINVGVMPCKVHKQCLKVAPEYTVPTSESTATHAYTHVYLTLEQFF